MSAIPSWARKYWPELAWGAWAALNLAVTVTLVNYETVPFHFIWVSLTLMYGWRAWRLGRTLATLAVVCIASGVALGWVVVQGPQGPDELTEVPLMGAMFLAMVWHGERRQAALQGVRRAAARERDFLRAASHQLKTPITIARGLASLMQSRGEINGDLDDLVEELERLGRIGDDLLLLAAAEQDDSLVCSEVDLEELLLVAATRRWGRTQDRRWAVSPCKGVLVRADQHRLESAIDAVLDNAVKATDEGDTISLHCHVEDGIAVVRIIDTGIGIDESALDHVFERFWSAPYGPEARRGTGLGLSIVEAIVKAHGGAVLIDSNLGQGTTVTIRLPGFRPADTAPSQLSPPARSGG